MNEDVNLTVSKLTTAVALLVASHGDKWEGSQGEAVEAAAQYVKQVLTK